MMISPDNSKITMAYPFFNDEEDHGAQVELAAIKDVDKFQNEITSASELCKILMWDALPYIFKFYQEEFDPEYVLKQNFKVSKLKDELKIKEIEEVGEKIYFFNGRFMQTLLLYSNDVKTKEIHAVKYRLDSTLMETFEGEDIDYLTQPNLDSEKESKINRTLNLQARLVLYKSLLDKKFNKCSLSSTHLNLLFTADGVVHCRINDNDQYIYKHTPNSNNFIAVENHEHASDDSQDEEQKSCILNLELVSRKGNRKIKQVECQFLHHFQTDRVPGKNMFILRINGCIAFVQQHAIKKEEGTNKKEEDEAILAKDTPIRVLKKISGDRICFHEYSKFIEFLNLEGDQLDVYTGISLKFETVVDSVFDSPCLAAIYKDQHRTKLLFLNMMEDWKTKKD